MSTENYTAKLTLGPVPASPRRARIAVTVTPERAAKGKAAYDAEILSDNLALLSPLLKRGFLGAQGVRFDVEVMAPDRILVTVTADVLPHDLIVMALRMTVRDFDSDPAALQRMIMMIGEAEARSVYAGIDFQTEVVGVSLSVEGEGGDVAFDPFHLSTTPEAAAHGPVLDTPRLIVPGWAGVMPKAALEDAILGLSGVRAFVPLGATTRHEPGEEEIFVQGRDLAVTDLSVEPAALVAWLSCLAPGTALPPLQIG